MELSAVSAATFSSMEFRTASSQDLQDKLMVFVGLHLKAIAESHSMNRAQRKRDYKWHVCNQAGKAKVSGDATLGGCKSNGPVVHAVGEPIAFVERSTSKLCEILDPSVGLERADLSHELAGRVREVERAPEGGLGDDLINQPDYRSK